MPYDHIDFAPPAGAREAARRALAVRAEKPESERGMTPVGIARARDLANGRRLSPATVRRMLAYFTRHEIDKRGETWDAQGKGWQAWNGWGGDPGHAWARKIVRQLDAADNARKMGEAPAAAEESVAVVLPLDEEVAEYVDLPGASRASAAHLTLCMIERDAVERAPDFLRRAVASWAAGCAAIPGTLSGVVRFAAPAGSDGPDAFALAVDAPGLSAVRESLVRHLRASGFEATNAHGFAPHVTLSYLAPDAPAPSLPYELPLPVVFATVATWIGEDRGEPVALSGTEAPWAMSGAESASDILDAESVHGATESITCRDAARVGSRTWNQVARYGTFRSHPQGGFAFGPAEFAQIVKNFRATQNRAVPVDYEHASERHPENVGQKGVPALAWIVDLDDRGKDGLWGLFDWKDPDAVDHVRAERYRYLSPAVNFNARDKETGAPIGARLTSCALTNQPFLDGMAPVTASERAPSGSVSDDADSTRLTLAPADVHVPTIPTALPKRITMPTANDPSAPMTEKGKDPEVSELDELKAKYTKLASDADASGLRLNEMTAAHKALSDKLMAVRGRLCAMASVDDAEGAEDIALEKLQAIVDQMRTAQKAEAEELAKRAASAHGLSDTAESLDRLTSMVLSDRATFLAMFPKAAKADTGSMTASEARAVSGSQTAPASAASTLLSTRVATNDAPPAAAAQGGTVQEISRARNEAATALVRDGKAKTMSEALMVVDRAQQKQTAASAVAPFVG